MTSETTPAQSCVAGPVPAPKLTARERSHAVQQQAKLAAPPLACSGTVFVGMFFDGTGNNEALDYNNGKVPPEKQKPSNVVRLYDAYKDVVRKRRLQEKSASSPDSISASSYKNNSKCGPWSQWRSTLRATSRRLLITGLAVGVLAGGAALIGCAEQTSSPGVTGYNHQADISIYTFSVNGSMGMALMPQSGGGKTSCCATIPSQWHPGLKVKVAWEYDGQGTLPPPKKPKSKSPNTACMT